MTFCLIKPFKNENRKAIITKNLQISYKELDILLEKPRNFHPIFSAPTTLGTLLNILYTFRHNLPCAPISIHETTLPDISIESSGLYLLTSGTTGSPKVIKHSFGSILKGARGIMPFCPYDSLDTFLLSLPLYHIAGLFIMLRAFLSGATLSFPHAVNTINHISFVPTQLKQYLENPLYPHLKTLLVGGASIPEELAKDALRKGIPLYLTYSSTETGSVAISKYCKEEGISYKNFSSYIELKIGEDNEILIKGGALPHENWHPTKDLGTFENGTLKIIGRKSRMLISGGENIFPEEIEDALMNIKSISYAKVSSRKDQKWGERPVAKILLRENISIEAIQKELERDLAKFKIPYKEDFKVVSDISLFSTKGL